MSVPTRVLALLLIGSVLLTACGSAGPTPTALPATATVAPLTLAAPTEPPASAELPAPTDAPVEVTPTVPPAATQPPVPQPPNTTGGRIAFYSERDGNAEIYTMNPDGSDPRRLTFNEFEDTAPAWSPGGRQIAFISDRDDPRPGACFPDCTYQLYVVNADGSGERRLAETGLTTHHPDWHPDGTRLIFDTEFNLQGNVYVIGVDGGAPELLIEDGFWADWSPDGSQIAFASNREGNLELYVADAGGGNQQRLTSSEAWELFPAWSPGGSEIAYFSCDPGCRPDRQDLYVMSAGGGEARRLTESPSTVDEDPAWSPDGNWIAFQSDRDGNYEIYAIGAGGGQAQRLTNSRGGDYWPSWGPEQNAGSSEEGLYLGQAPPGSEMVMFAPGVVSIEEGKEYNITIAPDLQEIVFTRRTPKGGNDRLWTGRVVDGKLAMPEPSPFGYDVLETDACFSPDGARLYFNSWRPLPGEESASRVHNVWVVEKIEDGWGEPEFLGPPLNDYGPVYFSFAADGTLYFTRSSPREIWYAELEEGEYREAQSLSGGVNDLREVAHPAIAPDESYVVVDALEVRDGRVLGVYLFVSFRQVDGSWTEAVSLRDALGASGSAVHAMPRITADGKYLFFEQYDQETDKSDIYWVSTKVVEELRNEMLE